MRLLEELVQDARFGLRSCLRQPVFAAAAIVSSFRVVGALALRQE